jgi:hypothetical protein
MLQNATSRGRFNALCDTSFVTDQPANVGENLRQHQISPSMSATVILPLIPNL